MATKSGITKTAVASLAGWAVAKMLEAKPLKGTLDEADAYAFLGQRSAGRIIRRAGRNATHNRAWLAAGFAAVAVGIGLMAKATRPK